MRGMLRLTTKPTRALPLLLVPVVLVLIYFSLTRSNGTPVPTPSAEAAVNRTTGVGDTAAYRHPGKADRP